jgi:flavorubredoxin
MEPVEGIHHVGVQDWDIKDFHRLYTPRGGSYNAYPILDEKTALLDAINREFFDELVGNVSRLVYPEKIDYAVMNHVEPDHSGALPLVMKKSKYIELGKRVAKAVKA